MKEQIHARKRAEEAAQGAQPAAQPAAKPVPKVTPKVTKSAARPVNKPVTKAAAKPVVKAGAKAGVKPVAKAGAKPVAKASVKPVAKAGVKPVAKAGAAGASTRRKAAGATATAEKRPSRTGAKRTGSGRRKGNDPEAVVDREFRPKKSSPLPMIGIVVVLAAGAFGAMQFLGGDDEANAAGPDTDVAAAGAGASALDDVTNGTEDANADDPTEAGDTEATPEPDPEPAEEEKPKKPKKKPSEMTDADYDPSEVSWDHLEKFGPSNDTTSEEWAEINRLVVQFTDPDAGAAGGRAGKKLEEQFKEKAFPALVNAMMKLDLTSDEGHRTGDVIQKRLQFIANGRNAGWKYERDEWPNKTAKYNRQVVVLLHGVWERAKEDPAYWRTYAKLDQKGAAEEAAVTDDGASEDELDELDELDDL